MTRQNVPFLNEGRRLFAALMFAGLLPSATYGQLEETPAFVEETPALDSNVQIESLQTSYDQNTGVATAVGNVDIRYEDVTIYAGSADYHRSSGDIFARDGVTIYKGDLFYSGDSAVYNIKSGDVTANDFRSGLGPVFYDALDMTLNARDTDIVTLSETALTTHDLESPNFHFKAKRIEIYPDDRIVFHDLKVYAGKTPVFWLPYLSQPFDDELGYSFTPGYTSRWGAFLLNSYGILLGDDSLLTLRLDARSKRGFAGGFDVLSARHRSNPNFGNLQFYYAHDDDPQENYSLQNRSAVDESRYRFGLQHRLYLPGPEESTLYVDIDINKFSDNFVLEDFFPAEFRVEPRPDNMINIVKQTPRAEISLWSRFRVNDFFTTDSRLPELAIDFTRQPIFDTGFFYEGETSLGLYRDEAADAARTDLERELLALQASLPGSPTPVATQSMIDSLRARVTGNEFFRFNTFHQVLHPIAVTDGFTVVPRAGISATTYSDVSGGIQNDDETRVLAHLGLDASVKFSKLYPDVKIPSLGVNKLRHIVQPYANYSFLAGDDLPAGFPLIDRFAPSTQLRPLDVPLFPAVDELREWNILRLGTRNRLQTYREGGSRSIGGDYYNRHVAARNGPTHNWLELDTFMDFYFNDGELGRDFSNLYNQLTWWPLPWLIARVDSQIPVTGDAFDFTEINSTLSFMPWRHTELTVGHRFLDNHPFFVDSSLLTVHTYTRISDNWGFSMNHRYELDDNTLEMQQYSIHRDLSSWTLGIGGMILDNRVDEEYGFVLTLSLKGFPKARLPLSVIPASQGL